MKHVAMIVNIINKQLRIYPREVIEDALLKAKEEIKCGRMFVTAQEPLAYTVPLNDIVAQVNDLYLDGDRLIVDFEFLKHNPLANAVHEELNRGNIALRAYGYGNCIWNEKYGEERAWFIKDYEIICFHFTYTPS